MYLLLQQFGCIAVMGYLSSLIGRAGIQLQCDNNGSR
jgi:hypothetical protein